MARKEKPHRSKTVRMLRRAAVLLAAGMIAFIGYRQLRPVLVQTQKTIYEPFTVTQGTVEKSMSMSGAISVGDQETITNQSSSSFTELLSVREIFVAPSQRVKRDDKLIQLSNGDIYRAGIDGVVNEIRVAQGDRVRPGATMMDICDVDHLIVTISVDEFDISRVDVGDPCTITVLPLGISFDTQIGHINRVSSGMGWVASYTVTADANAPESVWPGMQASVTIVQEQAVDVPVLPMTAISFDETGTPHVLKKTAEDTYERAEIEVGLSDGMNVQIVSGLSVGDTVWVQADAEQASAALSINEIYKKLFGAKTVIIDRTGAGRTGRTDRTGDMERDGFGGMDSMAEGFAIPEGLNLPEGFSLPEGVAQIEDAAGETAQVLPMGVNLPPDTATAGEASMRERPGGMSFPQGMATPGEAGMRERPQGANADFSGGRERDQTGGDGA